MTGVILIFFGLAIIVGTIFLFDKEDVKYHGYEYGPDLFWVLKLFGAPKWIFKLLLIILGILLLSLGVLYHTSYENFKNLFNQIGTFLLR